MSQKIVSNDLLVTEMKSTIPYIFSNLRKLYKDMVFRTEEELGVIYQEYLKFCYKKYSTVKTLLYKNEGKFLYDFYEHITLSNFKNDIIKTDNSERIFDESNNVIVTGTGGIGKSMFVKHIFINQIQQNMTIPIFIELKSLNDFDNTEKTLEDFVYAEIYNHHLHLEKQYFVKTLEFGKYTIIFDGLDEVSTSKRVWLDKSIKDFITLYNENRYIISSRPSEEFIGWDNFIEYEMQKFTKEQALSLINRLDYDTKIKKRFSKELKLNLYDSHESFASIPLLLTIMLITYEAGASIPSNLTDFYNQAFYTLYQRHDASKSGYKRELRAGLSPEEFKSVLSYIGMKTFLTNQVDFDTNNINEILTKYKNQQGMKFDDMDFIYDATNSACMIIQEGTDLKFSHRSFQEYFAALGISKLDDKLQKTILIQWAKSDMNNISAHKSFMNALFSIQKERTLKNLCIPIIEDIDDRYSQMKEIESIVENYFIWFRKSKDEQKIGFRLSSEYSYYFRLQFYIFKSIGIDITSIAGSDIAENYEKELFDLWDDDRKYYFDLNDVEKTLLNQWIKSWCVKRHEYLKEWAKEFISKTSTKKRTIQSIIDDI